MADFNIPVLATDYDDVLDELKARDVDAITLQVAAASNPPTGAIKWNRASDKFQEWDGAAYQDQVLSITGGGTGGATASAARTSLGLGTLAVQDDNAVNITGGTLAGNGAGLTSLNASNLASGTVPTARLGSGVANSSTFLRGDQTYAVPVSDPTYQADENADFVAAWGNVYNLIGSHTITLPTVVGNAGKSIRIINKGGSAWTVDPNGAEQILGGATWSFDFGQWSSATLMADANGGKVDVF
jgi:hypothetical protein